MDAEILKELKEIKKLLQVIASNQEQQEIRILFDKKTFEEVRMVNEEQKKQADGSILKFVENYFSSEEPKDPAMVEAIAELLKVIYSS